MSYAPARPFRCPRYPAPCYGPGDREGKREAISCTWVRWKREEGRWKRLAALGSDGRWKSEDGRKNRIPSIQPRLVLLSLFLPQTLQTTAGRIEFFPAPTKIKLFGRIISPFKIYIGSAFSNGSIAFCLIGVMYRSISIHFCFLASLRSNSDWRLSQN